MTVAISLVVLLGMVALTVDVGGLYVERRKLQNSADAAALAVAIDCAGGDCGIDPNATASNYALENNPRGASVQNITPWPLTPAAGTVTVDVSSGDDSGSADPVRNFFAPVVERLVSGTDDPASATTLVGASATAVWEPVGLGGSVVPFTISLCDFMGDPGPYTVAELDAKAAGLPSITDVKNGISDDEVTITLHSVTDEDACTVQPGFSAEDESSMPGGFGWLDLAVTDCQVNISAFEDDGQFWVKSKQGIGGSDAHMDCVRSEFEQAPAIPIFTGFINEPGTKEYRLYAPSGFYITGIAITGAKLPPGFTCDDPGDKCVRGHFVKAVAPGWAGGSGPSLGVSSVRLSE